MDIKYNKEKLKQILFDVYQLLKTPISIFDRDFVYVTSYPSNEYLTEYCTIIREDSARYEKCMNSDGMACAKCKKSGEGFSYLCHGNVLETITPIRFENLIIGYIIFGQYRMDSKEAEVLKYAEENGIRKDNFLSAYKNLTKLSSKQVEATCNILQSCILRFWLSDAITLSNNDLTEKIQSFIASNPEEKITAELLCRNFFISKQQLYRIFRQNFNMTVKEYVLDKKLEKAKLLLKTSELSVTEIANKTGFPDYNNFIQRFKNSVGTTPLKYRKDLKISPKQ